MQKEPLIAGVMSGTSADSFDVAIVRFPADAKPELTAFEQYPMPEKLREPILRLAQPGLNEIDAMGGLHRAIGRSIAKGINSTLEKQRLKPADITAIGSHGQTIRHRPQGIGGSLPFTVQIGDAATIAEDTGITVVSDFRSRDIAAGGQGAPLVPFAHRLLFAQPEQNIVIVNIGGIANITWLAADGGTSGFDTGPGNMVMDALMRELSDARDAFDRDGELAASGRICEPLLAELMKHPFLRKRPPKSTGREDFGIEALNRILGWVEITDADRLATTCDWTCRSIADARSFLAADPDGWLVCGGGAFNNHLMQRLKNLLAPATVKTTGDAGMPPQAVEAVCFAILARQTLHGLANSVPEVTGSRHASVGGQITPGDNWPEIMAWIRSPTP